MVVWVRMATANIKYGQWSKLVYILEVGPKHLLIDLIWEVIGRKERFDSVLI